MQRKAQKLKINKMQLNAQKLKNKEKSTKVAKIV